MNFCTKTPHEETKSKASVKRVGCQGRNLLKADKFISFILIVNRNKIDEFFHWGNSIEGETVKEINH